MYIPLRQPLSRYPFRLYRYPCCALFSMFGEPKRRSISRQLMGFERMRLLNFEIPV